MEFLAEGNERLDRFLARMLPEHSRSKLAKLIESGEVVVDGVVVTKPSAALAAGSKVSLDEVPESAAHDLTPADIPLDIVFEDEVMLIVNKQRGLAVHPAASLKEPSLVNALLARNTSLSQTGGDFRPGIVHRLDKETTGLLVVAKTDAAHVSLARQIEGKSAERRYFAVVAGEVERERFTIDAPMGRDAQNRIKMAVDPKGKRAVTHVRRVARVESGTLVACRLETGRTHQIRVHLRAIGNPVIGDALYAPSAYASGPMQLHAAYLGLEHPNTGERIEAFAPPPEDFQGAVRAERSVLDPWS